MAAMKGSHVRLVLLPIVVIIVLASIGVSIAMGIEGRRQSRIPRPDPHVLGHASDSYTILNLVSPGQPPGPNQWGVRVTTGPDGQAQTAGDCVLWLDDDVPAAKVRLTTWIVTSPGTWKVVHWVPPASMGPTTMGGE